MLVRCMTPPKGGHLQRELTGFSGKDASNYKNNNNNNNNNNNKNNSNHHQAKLLQFVQWCRHCVKRLYCVSKISSQATFSIVSLRHRVEPAARSLASLNPSDTLWTSYLANECWATNDPSPRNHLFCCWWISCHVSSKKTWSNKPGGRKQLHWRRCLVDDTPGQWSDWTPIRCKVASTML